MKAEYHIKSQEKFKNLNLTLKKLRRKKKSTSTTNIQSNPELNMMNS
jgi:hypothetical protein